MRYIDYGVAILAAVLTVAFATGYLPRDATASRNEINDTMNVLDWKLQVARRPYPDRKSLTRFIGRFAPLVDSSGYRRGFAA